VVSPPSPSPVGENRAQATPARRAVVPTHTREWRAEAATETGKDPGRGRPAEMMVGERGSGEREKMDSVDEVGLRAKRV